MSEELIPKGYASNPRTATSPQNTDLLGIQQGDQLLDMKKITYEDLKKPIVGEDWDGTTLKEVDDHANTLQDQVDALSVGGPKGVYDTLVDLQTTDPDHTFTYVVETDGNWYFWDTVTSDWMSGGIYNDSTAFNDLAGAGRTIETVKGNADAIAQIQDNKVTAFQETPDDTHYPSEKLVKDSLDGHETRIAVLEGWHPLNSWDDIQKVAKAGLASKYLKAGDLIETTYSGNPAIVEVVGINQDTPVAGAPAYKDIISFQFKDCLQNAQYSAPQSLYNAAEGLDAGTYTFINSYDSLPYTFTLTQAIPAGGVIVITSWCAGTYEPTVLKTMQADRLTNIETGVAVTQDSGGTALAPVNLTPRCRYGANLYIESGIRHFLNDNSESYLWVAQGLYDMPSTYGAGGGFLKRLDADFASVIGPVVKKVARATADGGGQDTIEDKVWLLSRVEMGYWTEGMTTGEQVYERWNNVTNAERIKLLSSSPRYWWLRPPFVSSQDIARVVNTDGTLFGSSSYDSSGLAPGLAVY